VTRAQPAKGPGSRRHGFARGASEVMIVGLSLNNKSVLPTQIFIRKKGNIFALRLSRLTVARAQPARGPGSIRYGFARRAGEAIIMGLSLTNKSVLPSIIFTRKNGAQICIQTEPADRGWSSTREGPRLQTAWLRSQSRRGYHRGPEPDQQKCFAY
jgi:hypothetical protein